MAEAARKMTAVAGANEARLGQYLTFHLGSEIFAIGILRICRKKARGGASGGSQHAAQ